MFSTTCPHCGKTRLLMVEDILSLKRTPSGVTGHVTCGCGRVILHTFEPNPRPARSIWPDEKWTDDNNPSTGPG